MINNIEKYYVKTIGELPRGTLNKITDVKGVRVGHYTVDTESNKTGVTVILPTEENIFINKLVAATFVLNGFGKSQGLIQVDELGNIETPIALTNTLNVGLVHDGLVEYMLNICDKENVEVKSINPIVCECNDSTLNDIKNRVIKKEHVFEAIKNAKKDFEEGDVGAGKGTICFGLKGGIGSSSRIIKVNNKEYTIGVLVQSNYGKTSDFIINGEKFGREIEEKIEGAILDRGSIIVVIATDLPVSDRQLKRIIKRASVGLARTGSIIGHGSGEIFIGFTTANKISYLDKEEIVNQKILNETIIDRAFRAVAEATEEAVLNSMFNASTVTGFNNKTKYSIKEFI